MRKWQNAGMPSRRGARVALRACLCACLLWAIPAAAAPAGERYALVISGASGGPQYAEQYDAWRTAFVATLAKTFEYPADHVVILAEEESSGVGKATRENVRQAMATLRARATKDDVVLVLLIGHGTAENDEAKFNLVGPDLSALEWADLVRPIAGRMVFIDTASGSFPFLRRLAGRGRVVLTANDSSAQQYETVFPGFFIKAFEDGNADLDKNGKVSIWEAFVAASHEVRRWYQEHGQLATERPLLDDTGNGVGREADSAGQDGPLAQVTYLQPDAPIAETGDSELTSLLRRRAEIESELERLRASKPNLLPDEYEAALEKLLLELARLDQRVRAKT